MMVRVRQNGFTLIEMITVIVLGAVIASFVAQNISQPIEGFVDTARRAALVDTAGTAAGRLTREAQLALPNSVRVSAAGEAVEFLRTRTGGRYRALADPGGGSDPLLFAGGDTSFDVLGRLREFGRICAGTSPSCGGAVASTANCMNDPLLDCLVIFNTGQPADCSAPITPRSNAYCGDNVAAVDVADVVGETISFVHDAGDFPLASPQQRFHVIDTPVSYICDVANRQLRRYDGYAIAAVQPTLASPPAGAGRILASDLVACRFDYDPGTATRAAILSVTLTLADAAAPNERVTLFQQAHVANAP